MTVTGSQTCGICKRKWAAPRGIRQRVCGRLGHKFSRHWQRITSPLPPEQKR